MNTLAKELPAAGHAHIKRTPAKNPLSAQLARARQPTTRSPRKRVPNKESDDGNPEPSAPKKHRRRKEREDIRLIFAKLSDDVFIGEHDVAKIVGFSGFTLRNWRLKEPGRGPTPTLFHSSLTFYDVRYRVGELRRWIAAMTSPAGVP